MTADRTTRRDFLESTMMAGLGLSVLFSEREARAAENDPVRFGFVGIGSRGTELLRQTLKVPGARVLALCDVNDDALRTAQAVAGGKAAAFRDYRKLLEGKDLDAVVVATPQHMHAPVALAALDAGKHVYCEKALGYTIDECYDLVHAAKEARRVFQTGHQRRYSPVYLAAKDMIDRGEIGRITWVRGQWCRNTDDRRPCMDPKDDPEINWRVYAEHTGGLLSEFGAHQIDIANWYLGSAPVSVMGSGGVDFHRDGRDTYDNVHVIYDYPNGVRFTYTTLMTNAFFGPFEMFLGTDGAIETALQWGGKVYPEARKIGKTGGTPAPVHPADAMGSVLKGARPPREKDPGRYPNLEYFWPWGGTVLPDGKMPSLKELELQKGHSPPETLAAVTSFVDCCRTGKKPLADVQAGCDAAVASIMGNIAIREKRIVYLREFSPV